MFSDIALSLTIEIEENNILKLYSEIEKYMKILESKPENIRANSKKEWWNLMNVSFSAGKGNLTVDIPDFPG